MLTVETVTDLVYSNAEGTGINCQVKFEEFNQVLPFHATAWDDEPHGVQLYNDLKAGKYGPIAPYVAPVLTPANNQPVTTGTQAA
jgi:hypothetical protein